MNPISKISIKLILCFFLTPVYAAMETMCGEVSSDAVTGYRCMKENYAYDDPNFPYASFDTNFNIVCVNYSTSGYDSSHGISYLKDCYPLYGAYKCWNSNYYDDSGCLACPNNTLASNNPGDTGHMGRSCDYCPNTYYMNDDSSACLPCPDGGQTDTRGGDGPALAPDIESCFLPRNVENTNPTGSFVYIGDCNWSK